MTEQPPTYTQRPVELRQPKNGLGTAALVLGIVGAALAWIPIIGFMGFVCGILGVVFGAIGVNRVRKQTATNRGASWAGLILSIVAIVLSSVVWVGTLNAVDDAVDDLDTELLEDFNRENGTDFDTWDDVEATTDDMERFADCLTELDPDAGTAADYDRCNAMLDK